MKRLSQFARLAGLALIVATTTLPAYAVRQCACYYCLAVHPATPCSSNGVTTTCGQWLAIVLCPPEG